jgi:23S rRNA (uracil1939-C5)-methyltransferase
MVFEFAAQKLVYGGEALGHYRGRPVLVPRALPGERLEVEAVRTAKGVMHARPLRILEPAAERVEPPCPYFGRCGGCQYQHFKPERQTSAKSGILRESLRRIGKINWQADIALRAGPAWNYRNQARFTVAGGPEGRVTLGFFQAESHQLFPVDVCLILSPRLNVILGELYRREWSDRLAGCREIELLADDRDEQAMVTLRGQVGWPEGGALAQDCLGRLPGVVSVAVERGADYETFGQPALAYRVGEFRYRISPGSFFQASRFLLPELVSAVTGGESATSGPDSQALALDLFAGVGLFTLPLARSFAHVVAVEAHRKTAADLATNVKACGLTNVRAVQETAFDFLRRFAQVEPDLVVLDPPRAGVGASTLELLTALRPRRIHYVSCSPPTLARDLGFLTARGYRPISIDLFDLFPQTYHIECLAKLTRNDQPNS